MTDFRSSKQDFTGVETCLSKFDVELLNVSANFEIYKDKLQISFQSFFFQIPRRQTCYCAMRKSTFVGMFRIPVLTSGGKIWSHSFWIQLVK
jgi:hypothetical protein